MENTKSFIRFSFLIFIHQSGIKALDNDQLLSDLELTQFVIKMTINISELVGPECNLVV